MTEDDFVQTDPAWWLVDPQAEHLAPGRSSLATAFGTGDEWYTDEQSLRWVYHEIYNQHQDLFHHLDGVKTTKEQEKWLESLVAERVYGKEHPEQPAEPEALWDEERGMLWRFVGQDGSYEYAYSDDKKTIRPHTKWMSWEEVEAQADSSAVDQSEGPPTQTTASTSGPGVDWTPDDSVLDAIVELNKQKVKDTPDGESISILAGGVLVLIGDGHEANPVNYVRRQRDLSEGKLTVTKGGAFSKGGMRIGGIAPGKQDVVKQTIAMFSDKQVTFT